MPRTNYSTSLMVLAGGFGTRLRSAVSVIPKPLAPVSSQPFLSYLITNWVAQGVDSFIFLLHYQADLIEAFLKRQNREDNFKHCSMQILRESEPLGTGGAVSNAVQKFDLTESFLVANADTWLGSGIGQVQDAGTPAIAILQADNAGRYGKVSTQKNKIVSFEDKKNFSGAGWINAGLYHLDSELFHNWDGKPFSIEKDLFPGLAYTQRLKAVPLETDFIDIGVPADYFRFCKWVDSGKTKAL